MPTAASIIDRWPGSPASAWQPDRTLEMLGEGLIDPLAAARELKSAGEGAVNALLADELRFEQGVAALRSAAGIFGPASMAVGYVIEGCWRLGRFLYEQFPAIAECWDGFTSWLEELGEDIWETLSSWWETVCEWFEGWFSDVEDLAGTVAEAASGLAEESEAAMAELREEMADLTGEGDTARRVWDQAEYEQLQERNRRREERANELRGQAEEQAADDSYQSSSAEWNDEGEWTAEDEDWDEYGMNQGWDEGDWSAFWADNPDFLEE